VNGAIPASGLHPLFSMLAVLGISFSSLFLRRRHVSVLVRPSATTPSPVITVCGPSIAIGRVLCSGWPRIWTPIALFGARRRLRIAAGRAGLTPGVLEDGQWASDRLRGINPSDASNGIIDRGAPSEASPGRSPSNGGRDRNELIASTPRGRGGQAGSCVVEVRVAGSTRGAASSVTTNFTVAVARASPLRLRVISGLIRDYGRTVHDFRYKVKYFLHDVSVGRDRRGGRGENYRIFNALYASNGTSPKTAARAGPDRP